jgi:hypothetical protein
MTELAQLQVARPGRAIADRSGGRAVPPPAGADSGRATARAELDAALSGVELTAYDRRFLCRLSQWDKRTASTLASLVSRARQRGRREATLGAAELNTVLAALMDAFEYRTSGAASAGCWDCTARASGLCAEHARDADRARRFADLAIGLSGQLGQAPSPALGLPQFSLCGKGKED